MANNSRRSSDSGSGSRLAPADTNCLWPADSEPVISLSNVDFSRVEDTRREMESPDLAPAKPLVDWVEEGSTDMISKVIGGRYSIISRLATGGMSTVYKARHLLLQQDVALKVILPDKLGSSTATKRFLQEAQAAMALSHPRIASVREFGEDAGRPYLVMDYVPGQTLADYLFRSARPNQEWILTVAIQICQGLEHAHRQGIIHRDLKPANLILAPGDDNEPSVKIIDFGLAKRIDNNLAPGLTREGEIFGTPTYMSPQQCMGEEVDARADLYSLGCILYEMITGQPPFEHKNYVMVIMMHVNTEAKEIEANHISKNLKTVVRRCLSKDPSDRYQSAQALRQDLELIKNGQDSLKFLIDKSGINENVAVVPDRFASESSNSSISFVPPSNLLEGATTLDPISETKTGRQTSQKQLLFREQLYYHVFGIAGISLIVLALTKTVIEPWLIGQPPAYWYVIAVPSGFVATLCAYMAIFGKWGVKFWVKHFRAALQSIGVLAILAVVFWLCFSQSGISINQFWH